MAKSFNELRGKMSPERRERNAAEARRMLLEMTLQELRQAALTPTAKRKKSA